MSTQVLEEFAFLPQGGSAGAAANIESGYSLELKTRYL